MYIYIYFFLSKNRNNKMLRFDTVIVSKLPFSHTYDSPHERENTLKTINEYDFDVIYFLLKFNLF